MLIRDTEKTLAEQGCQNTANQEGARAPDGSSPTQPVQVVRSGSRALENRDRLVAYVRFLAALVFIATERGISTQESEVLSQWAKIARQALGAAEGRRDLAALLRSCGAGLHAIVPVSVREQGVSLFEASLHLVTRTFSAMRAAAEWRDAEASLDLPLLSDPCQRSNRPWAPDGLEGLPDLSRGLFFDAWQRVERAVRIEESAARAIGGILKVRAPQWLDSESPPEASHTTNDFASPAAGGAE